MKEKIYLDTFVFMDVLSGGPEAAKAEEHLNKLKKDANGVVSSILFTELAFHLKRKRGAMKAEEILLYVSSLPNMEVVPVTKEIAKVAGFLRARYAGKIPKKLTYFDCIHIATALSQNAKNS